MYTAQDSHRELMAHVNNKFDTINASSNAVRSNGGAVQDNGVGMFLDGLSHAIWWLWRAGPLAFSAKAGINWHELTGDKGASVERGAQALRRWKWFQVGLFWTTIFLLGGWSSMPTTLQFIPAWSVFFWLILYVRFAEFSLFRRGPIQWVATPIVRFFDGVHSWAIVMAALLPLPACFMLVNSSV